MKIFIADDDPLQRMSLRIVLTQDREIEIIGEADNGFSAVEKIQADPPDVSLVDVNMPGLSGIGATRILNKSVPRMKIIMLSTYSDENHIQEAMEAGADGYVSKFIGTDDLVRAIKFFHLGDPFLSPYILGVSPVFGSMQPT